jgi:hypothetical protein
MRAARSLAPAFLILLLGATGCHTYKYFDVTVRFDATAGNFDSVLVGSLDHCNVVVSGADSGDFPLAKGTCPNKVPTGDALSGGQFEFSSFADSGTVTFTVDAYKGLTNDPNCKVGEGVAPAPVTGDPTIKVMVDIKKVGDASNCPGG